MKNEDFTKNLIKGKIAEIVFERMLIEAGVFTVIHFGYEYILPELMRSAETRNNTNNDTVDAIRTAPDFAVINNETKTVKLIEVKYRKKMNKKDILNCATKMSAAWNPSYLFVASRDGFYFDAVGEIVEQHGKIEKLQHKSISTDLQKKYLKILNEMEH